MIAASPPLVLGDFGIDSLREGEDRKCDILTWHVEEVFRGGLAGTILFSFTDAWWKDGREVEGWEMGLTDRARRPKPSFQAVKAAFARAPYFPLPRYPWVSVVVACYNGAKTLKACLDSLLALNYPSFEIILVDAGSTDGTPALILRLAQEFGLAGEVHRRDWINFGHNRQQALELAVAAARGDWLLIIDADEGLAYSDPEFFRQLQTGVT